MISQAAKYQRYLRGSLSLFNSIAAGRDLPGGAARQLDERGFAVVRGPIQSGELPILPAAYDRAVSSADPADVGSGRTTTRVWDFVNRGPEFDDLYIHPPVLEACCHVLGAPFHLSTMHARALNPGGKAQDLHADYRRPRWLADGRLIYMVDDFRVDNDATRFVPGSHHWPLAPGDVMTDAIAA